MTEQEPKRQSGSLRWVLYALITALIIASLYQSRNAKAPDWEQCKESLFTQMISGDCTPRRGLGGDQSPSSILPDSPGRKI
ncbi:hypothetical protein AB8880_06760 [Alphaproteobacteria bacterium LSUCC0684]